MLFPVVLLPRHASPHLPHPAGTKNGGESRGVKVLTTASLIYSHRCCRLAVYGNYKQRKYDLAEYLLGSEGAAFQCTWVLKLRFSELHFLCIRVALQQMICKVSFFAIFGIIRTSL